LTFEKKKNKAHDTMFIRHAEIYANVPGMKTFHTLHWSLPNMWELIPSAEFGGIACQQIRTWIP